MALDRKNISCLFYDYIGNKYEYSDEEILRFLDIMTTVYFTFSMCYFVLAFVSAGYIVKCVFRRDKLNCY